MYKLEGRSIIVTGAGSGMGEATAHLLAAHGAHVTLADINPHQGRATAEKIIGEGGRAQFVHVDVADEAQVRMMVEAAVATYGKLDGAFNNAAISGAGLPLHEMSAEQFDRTQRVNLYGIFYCMKHELAAMIASGGGSIVNNGAAAANVAVPCLGDYAASKAGMGALGRAAAVDYAHHNIRVNTILPGAIRTPMSRVAIEARPGLEEYLIDQHLIKRLGEPEEIAQAAAWLLSDASSFTTGASIPVDGGYLA